MTLRSFLLISLLSVTGGAALPLRAQTVINVPLEQYPPLTVLAEQVTVDLPPEGFTLGSDLVVTGGDGTYTYTWTDAEGNTLSQSPTLTITNPGSYFLTVTDGHDCRVSTQFTATPGTGISNAQAEAPHSIRLFNLKGQLLSTFTGTSARAAKPTYGLPTGVYIECRYYKDGHSDIRKITIH